jgi:phage terminase large subunit-like protein
MRSALRVTGFEVSEFIEGLCRQVKDSVGGRAGEPLLLRPWQKMLLGDVFARRADGRRKHRTAIVGMARKNGKSALGSGIALACVDAWAEWWRGVFVCGGS